MCHYKIQLNYSIIVENNTLENISINPLVLYYL